MLGEARILFGGSFNPPHIGHQALLEALDARFSRATLTLIPVHTHAFGKALVPFATRLRWCEVLADSISERIEVTDVEQSLDGSSLRTVEHFRALEPTRRLVWAIGSDLLQSLSSWRGAASLARRVEFCVFQRGGAVVDETLVVSPTVLPEISSSELRSQLARGEIAQSALPEVLKPHFLKDNPYLDHP